MTHILTLFELSPEQIGEILGLAATLKKEAVAGKRRSLLAGKSIALLFEKPSLRTRVSFEAGMAQLGGTALFLGSDVGWGKREPAEDFAGVLSQYVDAIVCRANTHARVEELARYANCPVINGLTDLAHPCQALADLLTVQEHLGSLENAKLAYVGDANNVARSLAVACGKLNVEFALAAPKEYQFDEEFCKTIKKDFPKLKFTETSDPAAAVENADAVYTDVWTSMGQEAEREAREKALLPYQVNEKLMSSAKKNACFLHCLPARRGEEVTTEVIDGPQSAIIRQAANRMHIQKGLLAWLLG